MHTYIHVSDIWGTQRYNSLIRSLIIPIHIFTYYIAIQTRAPARS